MVRFGWSLYTVSLPPPEPPTTADGTASDIAVVVTIPLLIVDKRCALLFAWVKAGHSTSGRKCKEVKGEEGVEGVEPEVQVVEVGG